MKIVKIERIPRSLSCYLIADNGIYYKIIGYHSWTYSKYYLHQEFLLAIPLYTNNIISAINKAIKILEENNAEENN